MLVFYKKGRNLLCWTCTLRRGGWNSFCSGPGSAGVFYLLKGSIFPFFPLPTDCLDFLFSPHYCKVFVLQYKAPQGDYCINQNELNWMFFGQMTVIFGHNMHHHLWQKPKLRCQLTWDITTLATKFNKLNILLWKYSLSHNYIYLNMS